MGRSHSSISEEIRRNTVSGEYDARKADHKSYERRKYAKYQGMKIVQNPELRNYVDFHLEDGQSPGAISGRLEYVDTSLEYASKTTLYEYQKSPYGKLLNLPTPRKRRKQRSGERLENRRWIDERPSSILAKKEIGHTEGDFIVSGRTGKGIVFAIKDLKIKAPFMERILDPTCDTLLEAARRIKKRFPEWATMTTDNDILFAHHEELERELQIKIYFCHPGHFWEKNRIENLNQTLRRYIPKGDDISKYSEKFIHNLETKLLGKFMECLKYRTPQECLDEARKYKKR